MYNKDKGKDTGYSKVFDSVNLVELWKGWEQAEHDDIIRELVFHKELTDEQKIISLKMYLEKGKDTDDEVL